MATITWELLRRPQPAATDCAEVAVALGPLARWWLTEEALRSAADELESDWYTQRPPLPTQPGGCWMIVVNQDRSTQPLLRESFLLPLLWRRDLPHGRELPPEVRRLADNVLAALQDQPGVKDHRWGLTLAAEESNPPDLSQLCFGSESGAPPEADPAESGFAPLAAGLLMAVADLPSSPHVWATGGWNPQSGFETVGGLPQKLACAAARGDVTDFFVPAKQKRDGEDTNRSPGLRVRPLTSGPNLRVALNGLLAAWGREPDEDAELNSLVEFHRSQYCRDRSLAEDFYRRKILPRLTPAPLSTTSFRGAPSASPITHGVTIVSHNWETIPQFAVVLGIQHLCILLGGSPPLHSKAQEAAQWFCRDGPESAICQVQVCSFRYPSSTAGTTFRQELANSLRESLAEFLKDVSPEQIAYFLLPGLTMMKLALAEAIAAPGSLLVCLENAYDEELKITRPGSERFITWRAGEPWWGESAPAP